MENALPSYFPPDLLFIVTFASADISFFTNFLNFIQHMYEKNIFVTNFPFLTDSLISPTPLQPQSAKHDKSFLLILP